MPKKGAKFKDVLNFVNIKVLGYCIICEYRYGFKFFSLETCTPVS